MFGKTLTRWLRSRLRESFSYASLRRHGVVVGEGLRMRGRVYCERHASATITLGNKVTIHNNIAGNPAGAWNPSVLVAQEGARLTIGNHVGMSAVVIFCANEINIEDHVNLGVGAKLYD